MPVSLPTEWLSARPAIFINERIEQVTAQGMAFDFGFTYVPNWRGLKFGVVVKNFGPEMKFDGPNFDNSVIPPGNRARIRHQRTCARRTRRLNCRRRLQFGAAWNPLNRPNEKNNVEFATVFQSNNFSQDEFRGGAEYSYNDMFFLRGGYAGSNQI